MQVKNNIRQHVRWREIRSDNGNINISADWPFHVGCQIFSQDGGWCATSARNITGPLKLGPIGCPETSVRNYQYGLRNIPKCAVLIYITAEVSNHEWTFCARYQRSYSKRNCSHFTITAPSCVQKYFQKVRGLPSALAVGPRSYTKTPWNAFSNKRTCLHSCDHIRLEHWQTTTTTFGPHQKGCQPTDELVISQSH